MFDDFKDITGYDLEAYFRRFVDFVNNFSQNIIDYYKGEVESLDRDSYGEYQSLLKESDYVINLFDLNMERFPTVNYWELMEYADDIKTKLLTIGNFSKFARSSVKKDSFSSDVQIEIATRDNETIEELIARLGSTDRDTDWMDVAIDNRLEQEDYTTSDGGILLKVNYRNNAKFFIESIIDNPEGEKIKGLDLDKRLQFVDNDLKVLGYDDTLLQTMNILINLRKNDNPEFPQYGINPSLISGMSIKSVALPSVLRQLYQTFSTDDIVKRLEVSDTEFDLDNINMKVNISIKSGEEQKLALDL